ncbi:MAG: LysR substrate-binding domain-containing protein [Pseudomonadota bacterium]
MLNISIRQLRSVLAIEKHRKISSAAKALSLTSPAVTLQLQQLEEELGGELFVRTRDGAIATDLGTLVIQSARRIFGELDALEDMVDAYNGTRSGRLRLGVVSTGKYFAPRMLAAFGEEFPGIDITLAAANRAEIIESLRTYEIDIAMMGRPPKHFDVNASLFGDHPLVFIAHPDNPLASQIDIPRHEIAQQKIIMREQGSGTRASLEFFLSQIGRGDDLTTMEMQSNETIKQAVMANMGIALISGHTIEHECKSGLLKILDVENTPIRRQWYAVRRADRTPSPAMISFETFLREHGMRLLPILSKTYPSPSSAA